MRTLILRPASAAEDDKLVTPSFMSPAAAVNLRLVSSNAFEFLGSSGISGPAAVKPALATSASLSLAVCATVPSVLPVCDGAKGEGVSAGMRLYSFKGELDGAHTCAPPPSATGGHNYCD
jgi:hypothetical protein